MAGRTEMSSEAAHFTAATDQPYVYTRKELAEPDWRRDPGWAAVTEAQWQDPQWQRAHSVKNIAQLRAVMGHLLDDRFYEDLIADQQHSMPWYPRQQRETLGLIEGFLKKDCGPGGL